MVTPILTDEYALYHGDCIQIMPQLPTGSVHYSIYSPPFGGLYHYSSDPRDLSNAANVDDFLAHYAYVVEEVTRLTAPGRLTAVHCAEIPQSNTGHNDGLYDLPGDIIRLHERYGWHYVARMHIWKEPLRVRNRTMAKGLTHKTIVEDSSQHSIAHADYLLLFRHAGDNTTPIAHPHGFTEYAGATPVPAELQQYRGHTGSQIANKYSHWIWRRYASSNWDDVRIDRVLPYQEARDEDDEKHVHPLQLDVIERGIALHTNPGDVVLTPFMGVGSEVYAAVRHGRKGIGIELKETYFRQAAANVATAKQQHVAEALPLFASLLTEDAAHAWHPHEQFSHAKQGGGHPQ